MKGCRWELNAYNLVPRGGGGNWGGDFCAGFAGMEVRVKQAVFTVQTSNDDNE